MLKIKDNVDLKEVVKVLNETTDYLEKENESLKNNYNDNEQVIHKIMEENEKLKNQLDFIDEQNKYIDKLEKIKWNEKESRAGILRTDQEIEVLARRTETLKKKIAELINHINKIEEKLDEK